MTKISFSREERAEIVSLIQGWFQNERDEEIGALAAEQLLDFFAEKIGPSFYNRGLYDVQSLLQARLDDIAEAIYQLEKPAGR